MDCAQLNLEGAKAWSKLEKLHAARNKIAEVQQHMMMVVMYCKTKGKVLTAALFSPIWALSHGINSHAVYTMLQQNPI